MAKIVGDVAISVGADISGLQSGMKKGSRSVKGFEKNSEQMAKTFVKAGAAIATAAAAAGAGVLAMAREAGKAGKELQTLSNLAGIGTTEFQRMAIAADTVLIGQEKLADIFKDVNDKFGDFMATGAGPLVDFFENIAPAVGVTADQFAALSGPQALQLYVSSLEKANVSQQQMTFYMEALASDATALVPLLKNGGAAMQSLGDEAERAGQILSDETVAGAVELDRELQSLSRTLKADAMRAIIAYEEEILTFAVIVTDTIIPAIGEFIGAITDISSAIGRAGAATRGFFAGISTGVDDYVNRAENEQQAIKDHFEFLENAGDLVDGLYEDLYKPTSQQESVIETDPITPIKPIKPTGGGGGGGNISDDLDKLREQFATENEIIQEEFANQLAQLEEFRAAKIGKEEEFNELERRIRKDHEQKMSEISRSEMDSKLSSVQGAFGDLATLMSSSNKRIFAIGKAAAIASATISGYKAAVDAWEKGMEVGGPPVAAAFTAASLAKTGALISGIVSQQASGGGASAGSGGGATSTPAPAQQVSQVNNVRIVGDNFSQSQVVELINSLVTDGQQLNIQKV